MSLMGEDFSFFTKIPLLNCYFCTIDTVLVYQFITHMQEQQNIEWKETWRDEYLKWICGFANAQGGKIYIGKNDKGKVVGLLNSKKLLEDIPNKIKDTMGIISDVNLLTSDDKEYIEVIVNPSSYPVSYKGEYHYRSGSTKQQLQGSALTEFLISRTGLKWDAVAVDNFAIENLDAESFNIFRKEALRSGRMTKKDLEIPRKELLNKLNLLTDGKLKRAAVLLFHKNPEQLITGCFVKIGRFGKGADLQYQDELRGSLLNVADKVIELIYLKYLKATISYNKEIRIETYPFPREGVREAIYNALIHSNFSDSIPIQIRIEDEAMYISNSCVLPTGWSIDTLMSKHKSRPYNPDIANTFFRAGYVEAWGRGVEKICEACHLHGIPTPEYQVVGNDITVKFTAYKDTKTSKPQNEALNDALENKIKQVITESPKITQQGIANLLNVSRATIQRKIKMMLEQQKIERIGGKRFGFWKVIADEID